ncbi:EAL domain-containing protein [Sporosarcina aquimarina]|uniref:sensor domain-containing protein n=1 Tax=Sporosarcina aquimarina TaxID=114975 RepID=UPI0020424FD4|nr:EAL domain-containing protein [Sporosarcina aquimarina]MCM3757734.1 EAL domain-containing protein [Sporosarcina aquimarina]
MTNHQDMIHNLVQRQPQLEVSQLLNDIVYAIDNSAIVAITDKTGEIIYANEFFSNLSQYSQDELIGANQRIVNSGFHPKSFFKEMWKTIGQGRIWRGEICNRAKDGSHYWVDTTIVPFLNEKGIPNQYISIRHDITEKKSIEVTLRKQAELYRLITENSGDYIAVVDAKGRIHYQSPSIEKLIGGSNPDVLKAMVSEDLDNLKDALHRINQTHVHEVSVEFHLKVNQNCIMQMSGSLSRITTEGEYVGFSVLVIHDNTAVKQQEKLILDLASLDQLTGLLNRRSFLKELFVEIERVKNTDELLGLVHLNIDKLRYANETFGHDRGDEIIKKIAERLAFHLDGALCGRTAGDEFAFVMKSKKSPEELFEWTCLLQKIIEAPVEVAGQLYNPSVSCGLSVYPIHATEVPGWITTTQQAMQYVKGQGGSGSAIFVPDMYSKSLDRIILENELRKSVKEEHFLLEYQPKVNLDKEVIVGFEALVRWQHPDLGRIPPDKFIGLAEETKIIIPLGEWILEEAFKKAKELQTVCSLPITVAVNLSAVQLESPDLIPFVRSLLEKTALDPAYIELEVTESAFADRLEMSSSLRQLRDLGFVVSIDDFGTGFSSFSYIKEFPAETLKIDMSFVRDIETSENSRAIIKAIVTMADTAGMNVIAEGIENAQQADIVRQLGCREGQGYFYSRPIPAAEICELLEKFTKSSKNAE